MSVASYFKEITEQPDKKLTKYQINELIKLLTLYNQKDELIASQIKGITDILQNNRTLKISNNDIIQRALAELTKKERHQDLDEDLQYDLRQTHDGDY
jgi:hypothetical protein